MVFDPGGVDGTDELLQGHKMKRKLLKKSLLLLIAVFGCTTLLVSCKKKNKIDEEGTVNLKIVNASTDNKPKTFYLANKVVVAGGLAYLNVSNTIGFNSGSKLVAEFRNEDSGSAYASGTFNFSNGLNYTVFLAGKGNDARVKVFVDDLSAVSDKAKVKFVYLNDGFAARVDIKNGNNNLVTNLLKDNASGYINMDAGTNNIQIIPSGQSSGLSTFINATFIAGKVYTIYIAGSSATDIAVRQITY